MATVELAAVRRAEAIQLRIAGHSQDAVAEKLGVTQQRVSAIEREWLASRQPSSEVTEERRQKQLASIDSVRSRLFEHIEGEDGKPDVAIVDRIAKLWEREAKLVGLDLQQGVNITLVTREALAAALWDADAGVIDVDASEVTDADA